MDYLRLGDLLLLSADGVTGFDESTKHTYARIALTSGKPVLQEIGEDLAEITLKIILRIALGHDVNETLETLNKMQEAGEAYLLVFAGGLFKGEYVIQSRNTSVLRTDKDGNLKEADVEIQLLEYADRSINAPGNVEKSNTTSNRQVKQ